MKEKIKTRELYKAPKTEIVMFQVERGFAGSGGPGPAPADGWDVKILKN